jgi:hypothetical protein
LAPPGGSLGVHALMVNTDCVVVRLGDIFNADEAAII